MAEGESVLCVGVYLADRANTAAQTFRALNNSRDVRVTQRWTALTLGKDDFRLDVPATVSVIEKPTPRCHLLNKMLSDAERFDWVLIVDDDIEAPPGFVDALIFVALSFDFAVCQPARTPDSFVDHAIVRRHAGLLARQSRFVEIGPVVLIRRDAMPYLLPFAENDSMGWGLDFVWPVRMENAGLKMGIIDAVPVAHRMRPPCEGYAWSAANKEMAEALAREPYLSKEEAFRVLEAYS